MLRVLVGHLQRVGVVARALAGRARRVDAGQEQQLDHDEAFAGAVLAAALGHVEGKAAGIVAPLLRGRRGGEQLAHVVEQAGVGGQVRARRAADRLLVHPHQAAHAFHAADDPAFGRDLGFAAPGPAPRPPRPRARPGPAPAPTRSTSTWLTRLDLPEPDTPVTPRQHAQRERRRQVVQVVAGDAFQAQPAGRLARRARRQAISSNR